MSDIAIQVENISKKYQLGGIGAGTLRETLSNGWNRLRGRNGQINREANEFWALKDINFEVKQGEVVGIIGKNGAGKSTLLKVLSRITEPTTGQIKLGGRIASLLEVGTGFHLELTGRENIFLNGGILGMRKDEIKRKFDEIVDFSGVEKFLDTPVKRYSSGMYVRLAFAVAAHLEPEILVIDEVLAVGDSEFQKKCLGKMQDVAGQGRTVLFVSHNMATVKSLCTKGIMLQKGEITFQGAVEDTISQYENVALSAGMPNPMSVDPDTKFPLWLEQVQMFSNGESRARIRMGESVLFQFNVRSQKVVNDAVVGFVVHSSSGEMIVNSNNIFLPHTSFGKGVQEGVIECDLGVLPLMAGRYSISLWIGKSLQEMQVFKEFFFFEVEEYDAWGKGKHPPKRTSPMWWPTKISLKEQSLNHV